MKKFKENKKPSTELEFKAREGRRLYMREYRANKKEQIQAKQVEYWAKKADEYKEDNK